MKKKFLSLLIILPIALLVNINNVNAVSLGFFGGGTGTTGSTSLSGGSCTSGYCLLKSVGLKVNLVKVSDSGPETVSYYYLVDNTTNLTKYLQMESTNTFGANAVIGHITKNGYDVNSQRVGTVVTTNFYSWGTKGSGMANIDGNKVIKKLKSDDNALVYEMLYYLLTDSNAHSLPNSITPRMQSIKDGKGAYIKWLFKCAQNTKDTQYAACRDSIIGLNDYRIILEPIYAFGDTSGKSRVYATAKATSLRGDILKAFYGSLVAQNMYSCTPTHGTINKNIKTSCPSQDGLSDVNNGNGYLIVQIIEEGNACNPSDPNGKVCCYTKDKAGKMQYDSQLDGTEKTDRYKCVLKGTDTPSPDAQPYCPSDGTAEFKECGGCDPTRECCYDASGTYHKEFSGTDKKETYKCTTTPNADKSCPGVGTAVNAITACYKEEDKCPEITLADGTVKGTGVNGTTTPFVHNYYFVDKILLANYDDEYNRYCLKSSGRARGNNYNKNQFYISTGYTYTCDEYNSIYSNSGNAHKQLTLYNENFEPYKIFDNIAKQQGLSVTNYEVIGARQVSLSTNDLYDFYKTYRDLRNTENYYYTDNAGNYFIASSNSFIESSDSLELDHKGFFAPNYYSDSSIFNGVSIKKIEQNSEQTNTYVKFNITKNYNTKNFEYYPTSSTWYREKNYAYHPVQYKISYCLSTEEKLPSCDDDVDQADCEYDDIGTKAQFHENDSLSACTLNNKAQSGFSLVNAKETQADYNKKSYCEVACKDDFDIELPTTKHAVAGRYFKLDKYIPKLSVKRTCVTTNMNYDEFAADLESAKNDMIKAYNDWQDYKEYYNHLVSDVSYGPTISGVYEWTTHSCGSRSCGKDGNSCCGETHHHECNYSYNDWSDSDYTATNGNQFSAKSGTKGKQEGRSCPSASSSQHLETARENAKTEMNQKQTIYNKSKSNYEDLIGKYNKCSSWVNGQKMDFESGDKKLEVFFSYEDEDSSVFPTPKKLTQEKISGTTTTTSYWNHGQSTDENYTTGIKDTNANNHKQRPIKVVCEEGVDGKTCNNATNDKQIEFIDSPYIMRTEEVSYQYKLPTVYTLIPNGTVTVNLEGKNVANYKLDEQAAPVNINTPEDSYEYTIQIQNVEDAVRQQRKKVTSNTKKDNFEDRFNGKTGNGVLTKNDTYVCDYEVINDIYLPKEMVYNSKTGKLNFFYRVIDMDNINPNGRSLGYNWNTAGAQTVKGRMKDINSDYQKLVGNEEFNGKTSEKFEFVLTPQMMRAIRKYNGTKNDENNGGYSDWDLTCTNEYDIYHCESLFLTCLAKGDSKTSDCSGIFEDNVLESNSKVSGYNFENLQENRSKLIKKLQELGQR